MTSRFRLGLTIFFLLLFSLENVVYASISPVSEKFSSHSNLDVQKDNLSPAAWISEANEERSDDKAHGYIADLPSISFALFSSYFVSKIRPGKIFSATTLTHQQILLLIGRLSI